MIQPYCTMTLTGRSFSSCIVPRLMSVFQCQLDYTRLSLWNTSFVCVIMFSYLIWQLNVDNTSGTSVNDHSETLFFNSDVECFWVFSGKPECNSSLHPNIERELWEVTDTTGGSRSSQWHQAASWPYIKQSGAATSWFPAWPVQPQPRRERVQQIQNADGCEWKCDAECHLDS